MCEVNASYNHKLSCVTVPLTKSDESHKIRSLDDWGEKKEKDAKEDNVLLNVVSFLTLPLQLDSSDQTDTSSFFAECPWCQHACDFEFVARGFLRKDEYRCMSCSQRTSKCIKFTLCGCATKSTFLWDDQLCTTCDKEVQRLGAGEISLGAFLENFQEENQTDSISVACRNTALCQSEDAGLIGSSNLSPNPQAMQVHLDALSGDGTADKEITSSYKSDMVTRLTAAKYCEHKSSTDDLRKSLETVGTKEPGAEALEEPFEEWMAVRDALLCWPGPERADIDRYRELCTHKSWILRWIVSCGGDQVWAIKRILAHLKWRQAYKLDTISQEDWAFYESRGEMYVSGVDKAGCPTWTWRANLHDASLSTPEMGTRFLICMMERTWAVNPMADRISVICDCSNLAFNNYEHKMFLLCLDILSEHYPGNLKMTYLFPVSWALYTVVSLGKNLLDPETQAKLVLLRQEEASRMLRTYFDEDQIEERLGGRLSLAAAARRRMLEEDTHLAAIWHKEAALAYHTNHRPCPAALALLSRALPSPAPPLRIGASQGGTGVQVGPDLEPREEPRDSIPDLAIDTSSLHLASHSPSPTSAGLQDSLTSDPYSLRETQDAAERLGQAIRPPPPSEQSIGAVPLDGPAPPPPSLYRSLLTSSPPRLVSAAAALVAAAAAVQLLSSGGGGVEVAAGVS